MITGFRFRSEHDGIVIEHALSAGAHYDPQLLSCGPVIGCDRHVVDPGAGFDWHAHAGVVIVSLVLSGVLRHEDESGDVLLLTPGPRVLVQSCGPGIRHTETNASSSESLTFVQTTLLVDAPRSVQVEGTPVALPDGVRVAIGPVGPGGPGGPVGPGGRRLDVRHGDHAVVALAL